MPRSKRSPKPSVVRKRPQTRVPRRTPASASIQAAIPSREAEPLRTARVQAALYRIADATSAVTNMDEFYTEMHRIVSELIYAPSFYLFLFDQITQMRVTAYWVDEAGDPPLPPMTLAELRDSKLLMGFVYRDGKILHLSKEERTALKARGELEPTGTPSEDWMGVPLKFNDQMIGALVVQSYKKGIRYTDQDVEILTFVAQHIATALTRARAIEETRQRNAELAVINSVQQGLAAQLDMQAIYDLVGDKIREIFDAQVVLLTQDDDAAEMIHYRYIYEKGKRIHEPPDPFFEFVRRIHREPQTIVINEDLEARSRELGMVNVWEGEPEKSLVLVPLVVGNHVTGTISLQNIDRENAFSDSDVRLLQTLANSMSVALENARLFEAERQRNAELAVINSVQRGLPHSSICKRSTTWSATRFARFLTRKVFKSLPMIMKQILGTGVIPSRRANDSTQSQRH
jgi:GAF domain-containing protein